MELTLWNIYDNVTYSTGIKGHHGNEYNPNDNTVFTFNNYDININGTYYRFDYINEYNLTGHVVWSLDTRSFVPLNQWCSFGDMVGRNRGMVHSNSIFYDAEEDVFYYNPRNLNTFYKIDHRTSEVIWGLGQYGNFTLFDIKGNQRPGLFFHPHAVEKIDDNQFILFDNDKHNFVNPSSERSRIVELTIDETTMTANESWVWTAPHDYFSHAIGDADRLPNGNRLGTFGTSSHPDSNIGARLVEVNEEGEIVWEMNFPTTATCKHKVHRMERFHWSPILSSPPDIWILSEDNVSVTWQTWYNFRAIRQMTGTYTLYLDGEPLESGSHVFDKFWRPTNLTFSLGHLETDNYNLTLVVADEAGHKTSDSVILSEDPIPTSTNVKTSSVEILFSSSGLICLVIILRRLRKKL